MKAARESSDSDLVVLRVNERLAQAQTVETDGEIVGPKVADHRCLLDFAVAPMRHPVAESKEKCAAAATRERIRTGDRFAVT